MCFMLSSSMKLPIHTHSLPCMYIGSAVGGADAMILLFAYVAPLCSRRSVVVVMWADANGWVGERAMLSRKTK